MDFDMLLDRFLANAAKYGDKTLFSFVDDKGSETSKYSYKEFEKATKNLATNLIGKVGLKAGENVMLVYPPGLDFILTFFSCLRAGVVPVPVYPPHPGKKKDITQFVTVQSSCGAKVALTNGEYNSAKKLLGIKNFFVSRGTNKEWPELKWTNTDKLSSSLNSSVDLSNIDKATDQDLAFLQYTSGSTSAPKGVMLTHGNLSHNLSCIVRSLEAIDDTVVVSWLPQYHDMGLIGAYLGVVYCGGSGVYMSPFSFIKNPALWLEMITKHGATHIQGPNFAYKLVLRKYKEYLKKHPEVQLDLSSLRHVFHAAEPIDVAAMRQFEEEFAQFGFKPEAFSPGFGLAENSVYVCDHGKISVTVNKTLLEEKNVVELVDPKDDSVAKSTLQGCGDPNLYPENNILVRIVDGFDDKNQLIRGEDTVGEIWISSPSKAVGYYGQEELTNNGLKAKLKIPEGDRVDGDDVLLGKDWLRTGDLGFFHEKELFICGRIKDLVIIRGRNHYPQDIEVTVENNHDEAKHLRPGCSAAVAVQESGDEVLVVVVEVRESSLSGKDKVNLATTAKAIKTAVLTEHELSPFSVILIKQGSIPKTTSGKIKRHAVRQQFVSGKFQELYRLQGNVMDTNNEQDATEVQNEENDGTVPKATVEGEVDPKIEARMVDEAARTLEQDIANIDVNLTLAALGMDSINRSQYKQFLLDDFQVDVSDEHMFLLTLRDICKLVSAGVKGEAPPEVHPAPASQNVVPNSAAPKKKPKVFLCC